MNTSKSTNSLGWLEVVGEVKNKGSETSNYTKVIVTLYDSTGKVIYADFTYTSPSDIPAGQAYGFKISLLDSTIASHVSNYELFTESHQYTSLSA